jgi:hypothetical protein
MDFNKKLARILPLLSEAKVGDELHTTIRGRNSPLSVGNLVAICYLDHEAATSISGGSSQLVNVLFVIQNFMLTMILIRC